MQKKQIAVTLIIDAQACIILQLRDDYPHIAYPNHWGLFGGKIEGDETPKAGAMREVSEELSIPVAAEKIHFLGEYHESPDITYHVFYYLGGAELNQAVLTEGQRIGTFTADELLQSEGGLLEGHPLVPIVAVVLRDYLKGERRS